MAQCALIIAGHFQPGLNVANELIRLDDLATRAVQWPVVDSKTLVDFLAKDQGFTGNKDNYYSITNSLLNHVLTTKRGIPITLALIYIAVVKRLKPHVKDLAIRGINFPAHFLLATTDQYGENLIDPFTGKIISREACYDIIANLYGQQPEHDERYFQTADNRQLLRRLLENLKTIHQQQGDRDNFNDCLDFQLMLYPDNSELLQQQQELLTHIRDNNDNSGDRILQ